MPVYRVSVVVKHYYEVRVRANSQHEAEQLSGGMWDTDNETDTAWYSSDVLAVLGDDEDADND